MGSYTRRLMSFLLAGLVAGGLMACEEGDTDAEADEQTDEEVEVTESEIDTDELPFYATGPIARIDGEEVGAETFNEMVAERMERMPGQVPPPMVEMMKNETIDFVIDKHLVDEVLEGEDIEVTDEDIDEALAEFKDRFPDEAVFEQQLAQMGMDEAELRENLHQDVELEKYLSAEHDLEVTAEEAETFFEENKERFAEEEQVQARHVLIEVDEGADEETESEAEERAQAVYQEAVDGADFEELAREKSEGPSAERGGDLGFFPRHRMVPEFAEVAFDMDVGDISEPVRTQFGYHVIEKLDHQEGGDAEFADVESDIEMQLLHQKRQEAFQSFLDDLKDGVEIEKLTDNIEVNVDGPPQGAGQGMPQLPQGEGQPQPTPGEGGGEQPQLELESPDLELDLDE